MFVGINLTTDELNNFIGEKLLFNKGNLSFANMSDNNSKCPLDMTKSQDSEDVTQGYCGYNNQNGKK